MTILDEAEYQRLQTAINDAERVFANHDTQTFPNLGSEIESKKARSQTLEHTVIFGPDSSERRKAETATAFAIAALVAQETNLSHQERLTYSEFLHQEHFTKANFEELDEFYQGPWERLSADGKREMSQRFWMGVEQGEYSFKEAPKSVRDKEADQLAHYTKHPEEAPEVIQRMSPQIKEEFLKAHESGNQAAVEEILSSKNSFEPAPKEKAQAASERSDEAAARESDADTAKIEATEIESKSTDLQNADKTASDDFGDFSLSMTNLPAQSGSSPTRGG